MTIDAETIVRALRRASGFSPLVDDAAELARRITTDPASLIALAEDIRFQASSWVATAAAPDHSQFGEFKLVLRALVSEAAAPGIVVDVGAYGRTASNSYDLVTSFGWKAVLIEATPDNAAALRAEFGDGDYQVIECAIGLATGVQPLWLGGASVVNSLDRSSAAFFGGQGNSIDVDVRRLSDVMTDADVPHDFDLLSIDIEGLDVAVFNDLIETSPFRPRYVIIEVTHGFQKQFDELGFASAVLDGYREIGRTLSNLILGRV